MDHKDVQIAEGLIAASIACTEAVRSFLLNGDADAAMSDVEHATVFLQQVTEALEKAGGYQEPGK